MLVALVVALAIAGLGYWFVAERRQRLRVAIEQLAIQRDLVPEESGIAWSGDVRGMRTRLALEAIPGSPPTFLTLHLEASNPYSIAFSLTSTGLTDDGRFGNAAQELVVALEAIRPRKRDALTVTSPGDIVYRLDLRRRGFMNPIWLAARLDDCHEIAKALPKSRGIRSNTRPIPTGPATEPAVMEPTIDSFDKTEVEKTQPFADEKMRSR